MLLLLVSGMYLAVKKNPTTKTFFSMSAHTPPTPTMTSATLSLANSTIQPDNTVSVTVNLNAPAANPSLAQIEIGYDPLSLQVDQVFAGSVFNNPEIMLQRINNRSGRLSVALRCNEEKNQPCSNTDKSVLAIINFTILTVGANTEITLLPKSLIQNKDEKIIPVKMQNATLQLPNSIPDTVASPSSILQF